MNFLRNFFGKPQEEEIATPSAETLAEAKKIFFQYSGNHTTMAQNDVPYGQYHISKAQEDEWRNEFIAHWRSQLSTEDLTAVQKLGEIHAVEAIPDLLAIVAQADSYAKLRIAQALGAISYWIDNDKSLRKQTKATSIKIAQSLLDHPVQVSERHKIEIERLGAKDPKDYIIAFAKNAVK